MRKPFTGVQVYKGVRVELDGRTYELHYHGDKKHIRCYWRDGLTVRKVHDPALVKRILEHSVRIRQETEERNARIGGSSS